MNEFEKALKDNNNIEISKSIHLIIESIKKNPNDWDCGNHGWFIKNKNLDIEIYTSCSTTKHMKINNIYIPYNESLDTICKELTLYHLSKDINNKLKDL